MPASPITVMSFNVANAMGTEDDGVNAWAGRAALNVATIGTQLPDLIGMQQCDAGNIETYRELLPAYASVTGPAADEIDLPAYNAIYWDPARLQLVAAGGFYLSTTPDRWSRGWDAACVRAATWAHLRTLDRDAHFLHLNTHYDHIGETARLEGTGLILQRLAALREAALPVILTGDFNCNPWSPPIVDEVETTFTDRCYHLFRAGGFKDTFLEAGGIDSEATYTYHGFEGAGYRAERHHRAGRIDWILCLDGVTRVRTEAYTMVRDQAPPRYPSDHYPIVARLALERQ